MTSEEDAKFMAEAIRVAQQARLHSSPNPWVGAIVVAQGQVVGEGATGSFQTSEETNESPTVLERDKDLKPPSVEITVFSIVDAQTWRFANLQRLHFN